MHLHNLPQRILLALICSTILSCSGLSSTDLNSTTALTSGTKIQFKDLYDQDLTVYWGAATGGTGTYEYKLVTSTNQADLDTLTEADALSGANLLMDWSSATSKALSNLTVGAYNYYAVIARDSAGTKVLYTPKPRVQGKVIYKTNDKYNGNLGGIAGADAKCAASQPEGVDTSAVVRAFITVAGSRAACTDIANCVSGVDGIDWVLTPAWDFYSLYGEKVGTMGANSNIFSSVTKQIYPDGVMWTDSPWTGLDGDYATINGTCMDWTSSNSGHLGSVGHLSASDDGQFYAATLSCDTTAPLICVEQ